jgi:TfoX/Sxy family transcriptional regulator of competence genes
MFGGIAFLLNGNMSVGVHGREMIVRIDPEQADAALAEPHTRIFDLTGRPMKGWIMVEARALSSEKTLARWIGRGTEYAASLPRK